MVLLPEQNILDATLITLLTLLNWTTSHKENSEYFLYKFLNGRKFNILNIENNAAVFDLQAWYRQFFES